MAPTKKTNLSREDILKKKREAEKARLARIKSDPIKLAEYKEKQRLQYLKKKEKGQRKNVKEMTPREQRVTRKKWKKYSLNYRQKKQLLKHTTHNFIRQNTPSSTDDEMQQIVPEMQQIVPERQQIVPQIPDVNEDRRAQEAKKRSERQRKLRNKQLRKMEATVSKLKNKLKTHRQKYKRVKKQLKKVIKSVEKTPKTRIEEMSEDLTKKKELVKKALFGEVIKIQLEENYSNIKTHEEKTKFKQAISGKVVDKYKLWRIQNKALTYKKTGHNKTKKETKAKINVREMVREFLQDDANSRQASGKKEFVTQKQTKKQKRYLNDTLKNLYEKFLKTVPFTISYALFTRFRPFWVVPPTLSNRDTCTCTVHENMDLQLTALKKANILTTVSNYQTMLKMLCCDRYSERCLERTCDECCLKKLPYAEFDNTKPILLQQWVSKKESIIDLKTKKERFVTKCKKETQEILPKNLITKLENDMDKFFRHSFNILHQYNSIKQMKDSLSENDAIVHMDFSENFCTKYNQEIQSFHYGGSRTQISLHTVVVYLKDSVISHCTMSSNLFHHAGAIWAHLKPVLASLPSNIENIHFLSDGPVTQYRNKSMFYVLACKLQDMYPNFMRYTWNFHEAGHGKGAPDGVGATCKRTADQVIATGGDITNLQEFATVVRERCPGIKVDVIEGCEIEQMNTFINDNASKMEAFKGTLSVHQVVGSAYIPNRLTMKTLSCFCDPDGCDHFKLGSIHYQTESSDERTRLQTSTVFTDSEDDNVPLSTYTRNCSKLHSSPTAGVSGYALEQSRYNSGDYVLVKYVTKKTEYHYAAICSSVDEEEGELRVTFLKICDQNSTLFKLDERDVSDVPMNQIIKKLPVPNLISKGNRVFYQFKEKIDVFEK